MRTCISLVALSIAVLSLGLGGCARTTATTFVRSETTLGRVVVYRNGVAYFERYAEVQGDSLKLHVPSDKVDDFLKSLTVVDAATGEPAPISYPNAPAGGSIDMRVGVGKGAGAHRLKLSYVTEAPSWKPSYRVVVGQGGKVDLQGWAIVDNTSGEDWRDVRLGVGASSALSFRFDLMGLRVVDRETLQPNDLFAQAPPLGAASYGGRGPHRIVGDVSDDSLAETDAAGSDNAPRERPDRSPSTPSKRRVPIATEQGGEIHRLAQSLQQQGQKKQIVIEGFAQPTDRDKLGASLARAHKLRDQLVRDGIEAGRIVTRGLGEQAGRAGGARILEADLPQSEPEDEKSPAAAAKPPAKPSTEPIGTSHFESASTMTVAKGTSAMVSILRSETEGEVVYLYDPESARGNAQYPFRTLRFRNPTGSALESGPVSVFGDGRFVGEGLAEAIPGHSVAFVPFALDRQIQVERSSEERDEIARILTVQRGVFSTEIKHTKKSGFTVFNRMGERATVYVKHTVTPGYRLTKFPDTRSPVPGAGDASDHLAGANLFRIDLEPNAKAEVTIEEATPVQRTTDIRTAAGLGLVRAYLSSAAVEGPLKAHVEQLLRLNADMVKLEQEIGGTREQMAEFRVRMDEIHAQLVTLKAVKTAGPLIGHLEKKLQEISEKMSKATVDVVTLQEKLMVARVQFQTGVGDLSLDKNGSATASK